MAERLAEDLWRLDIPLVGNPPVSYTHLVGKFENMAAPGMADLCARLKARGYVLALASSKPESLCVPICEKFGFTPSLAVVTGSPPVGDWSKADVIRETMRRLEPVSYTHLDVYKRQAGGGAGPDGDAAVRGPLCDLYGGERQL